MILRPFFELVYGAEQTWEGRRLKELWAAMFQGSANVANNRVPPSALYKFGEIILVGIQKIRALQIVYALLLKIIAYEN